VKSVHIVHCITCFSMPRGKEQKQKSKGNGQPKRKNPSTRKPKVDGYDRSVAKWRANNNAPVKQIGASAAYATQQVGKAPVVRASRDSCNVMHREFIGNVTGAQNWAVASTFAINPGLAASFPWLSGIAQNWETYRFKKLRFCYYTRTGSNVPGSVILAHDPDSSDAAPSTEQIMTTYEAVQEDAPWKDICLALRASSLHEGQQRKFVRTAPLAANEDIKLYDSGNLYLAVVDGTAVSWGKLWVEYEIDFQTPQLPPAGLAVVTNGVMQAPAGTVASPLLNGVAAGTIVLTQALTVLSWTGLVIGQEYLVMISSSNTVTLTLGTWVGVTTKTSLGENGADYTVPYSVVATATAGSVTITASGATNVCTAVVTQLPAGLTW